MARSNAHKIGAPKVRRIETTVGETGVGVSNRTDVSYELGVEIDGRWVRFAAISAEHAETLGARGEALASADAPADTDA